MSIFDDIKAKGATYRLTEEALYAEALREMESGLRRDGIWAKALADSGMDNAKAQAKYINLRVQSLKDEVTLFVSELKRAEAQTQSQLASEKQKADENERRIAAQRPRLTQSEWPAHKVRARIVWLKFSIFIAVTLTLLFALSPNGGNLFFDIAIPAAAMGAVAVPFWGIGLLVDALRKSPPRSQSDTLL